MSRRREAFTKLCATSNIVSTPLEAHTDAPDAFARPWDLGPPDLIPAPNRLLKDSLFCGLLKKAQVQGGARCEVRGVLSSYVAAPRLRANAADEPFSAAR